MKKISTLERGIITLEGEGSFGYVKKKTLLYCTRLTKILDKKHCILKIIIGKKHLKFVKASSMIE